MEPDTHDEVFLDDWEVDDEELEALEPSPWRRRLIVAVAAVTVLAVGLVPLYNLIDRGQPDVAANGLEVCGFDYCAVQDAVQTAGLDLAMARFANTFLDDESAARLADSLAAHLGIEPLSLEVVDALDGQIEGQYSPGQRLILIERPARAWTVIHEVAHAESTGHGDDFVSTLVELTGWLDSQVGD